MVGAIAEFWVFVVGTSWIALNKNVPPTNNSATASNDEA
jgi:hypothetical protein